VRFEIVWLALGSLAAQQTSYTFGTTVVDNSGFEGQVYFLRENTQQLPNFSRMKPQGTIYTTLLNIPPRAFDEGFPNLSDRYEWFAIEYTGKFWIENPGHYRFRLLSDDGARLRIDGKLLIKNDGVHAPAAVSAGAALTRGTHDITVQYFQGPRFLVALVLSVAAPGQAWRIFDTRDFLPPKDPMDWTKGKIGEIRRDADR
jgi:hypothetical protein